MLKIDELIRNITEDLNQDMFSSNDFDNYLESYYDALLTSILNKVRKDVSNDDELDKIQRLRKNISDETRKQYKIIISYCKEDSELSNMKTTLKKYNFLHFLKLIIRIIDIDEEYDIKVNKCKKYFSTPWICDLTKYLYHHNEVPYLKLSQILITDSDKQYLDSLQTHPIYDLLNVNEYNHLKTYNLTTEGKNLYAFYIMKKINDDESSTNYNEGKVNEVLEYLIRYISTQYSERDKIKKPKLNSTSANCNLKKVTRLLDKQNDYSQSFVEKKYQQNQKFYEFKSIGGASWKNC